MGISVVGGRLAPLCSGCSCRSALVRASGKTIEIWKLAVLSDQCELVSVFAAGQFLGRAELPPLGNSGGSAGLEVLASGEAAILVEVVEVVGEGGVDVGEELKRLHSPEAEHCQLSLPELQV